MVITTKTTKTSQAIEITWKFNNLLHLNKILYLFVFDKSKLGNVVSE